MTCRHNLESVKIGSVLLGVKVSVTECALIVRAHTVLGTGRRDLGNESNEIVTYCGNGKLCLGLRILIFVEEALALGASVVSKHTGVQAMGSVLRIKLGVIVRKKLAVGFFTHVTDSEIGTGNKAACTSLNAFLIVASLGETSVVMAGAIICEHVCHIVIALLSCEYEFAGEVFLGSHFYALDNGLMTILTDITDNIAFKTVMCNVSDICIFILLALVFINVGLK